LKTGLVLDTLEQALWSRTKTEGFIRQSGRGCQYLSIRYTDKLAGAASMHRLVALAIHAITLRSRRSTHYTKPQPSGGVVPG
jgi:hypothetical protein